jgi:hypothetical protein
MMPNLDGTALEIQVDLPRLAKLGRKQSATTG